MPTHSVTAATPRIETVDERLVTEAGARAIVERLLGFQRLGGRTGIILRAWWQGELRWARNRASLTSDRRDLDIYIYRRHNGRNAHIFLNQTDDAALEAAMHAAERQLETNVGNSLGQAYDGVVARRPLLPFPDTPVWSAATYNVIPEQRGRLGRALCEGAEAQGLLSAGFLSMGIWERHFWQNSGESVFDNGDEVLPEPASTHVGVGAARRAREEGYNRCTEAQCSMTVRHRLGKGSGWAGLTNYDWSKIDAQVLAARALDKCVKSLDPVAIEPGRYTVILEPQAVHGLMGEFIGWLGARQDQEKGDGQGPFALAGRDPGTGLGRTKLGMRIIDERITVRHDPMDPRLGVMPRLGLGRVTWIENGVLRGLGYTRGNDASNYALPMLNENLPMLTRESYYMTGGETTMEEMIATTKRGIIVTRFSNAMRSMDHYGSLTMTGTTRDGLWLVENGKISKAVKNMRFTDSGLFVLNNVEQLGVPQPIFRPGELQKGLMPAYVPAIKARDFAFTALIDAV